nr:MAG: hypothetical protein AM324_13850 [Candidatus Thorarchaeota archaeon SMTZ1-83]
MFSTVAPPILAKLKSWSDLSSPSDGAPQRHLAAQLLHYRNLFGSVAAMLLVSDVIYRYSV